MLDTLFSTVITDGVFTARAFFLATVTSLVLGLFIAWIFSLRKKFSQSFLITLVLLPAIVQLVIMLVNGNIGAGVAVAGAFSLVRFRSAAGSGQEISAIFLAMAVGLATGMGYLPIAVVFTVIIALASLILTKTGFGAGNSEERILKVTIPEHLDYEGVFDDILSKYTERAEMTEVATASLGSLYRLSYSIILKNGASTKAMIDEMRTRNGNLEISCGRPVARTDEL